MTDWADDLVTKLLDNTPELKQVSLREIMASALRAERERCAKIAESERTLYFDDPEGHINADVRKAHAKIIAVIIRGGE